MQQEGDLVQPTTEVASEAPAALTRSRSGRLAAGLVKSGFVVAGMFLFILALRLLSKGAGGIGPLLRDNLGVSSAVNTLGFGWLFAYCVLSGSPVAAIALSFLDSGTITPLETFAMITGSRLGAAFIVLFVGFLYYLRGRPRLVSLSIGILSLSVTATTYLPALPVGYWLLQQPELEGVRLTLPPAISSVIDELFDPIVEFIFAGTNGWIVFGVGLITLLVAFKLLDRALPEVDSEHNVFGGVGSLIYRPSAMFLLGAFVTSLTLSVSVSLAILVPLSAKGLIRRENTLPYIMGANITTFIDTLVASLLIQDPAGFTVVLAEIISITIVSIIILTFFYRPYERAILKLLEKVVYSNTALAVFMVLMIVSPILLLLW